MDASSDAISDASITERMVDLTKEVPATTDLLRDIDRVREELRNVAENLVNAVPEEAVY